VNLAVLVLLGTMSAALLDYVFKSGATAQFGKGPVLTRYFALFYTVNQALSFLVQTFLTPIALRRLGLGRTVRWHPTAVAVGSVASLLGPRALTAPVARSLELVLRGSFLRSGYELFFTPVPPREKRAVKTFIDVGCDRMGDAFGAAILQMLLLLGPQQAIIPILVTALILASISYRITTRMDAAYSKVLEHGLLSRAIAVDAEHVLDSTTLSALMRTSFLPPGAAQVPAVPSASTPIPPPAAALRDPVVLRLRDLRSGDPKKVAAALEPGLPFDPLIAPQAIRSSAGTKCWNGQSRFSSSMVIEWLANWWMHCSIRSRISRCGVAYREYWRTAVRSGPWTAWCLPWKIPALRSAITPAGRSNFYIVRPAICASIPMMCGRLWNVNCPPPERFGMDTNCWTGATTMMNNIGFSTAFSRIARISRWSTSSV